MAKQFKIITVGCNFGIGAVLTQGGHPVAYVLRSFNKHETNQPTIGKELLSKVWGVKYFKPYVWKRI